MSGDNEKIVRGIESQKAHDASQEVGPVSKESPAMGRIMPPTGLPKNIKCIVITYDVLNDNVQVAGPLGEEELINHMFNRATEEIENLWEKMKANENIQ